MANAGASVWIINPRIARNQAIAGGSCCLVINPFVISRSSWWHLAEKRTQTFSHGEVRDDGVA